MQYGAPISHMGQMLNECMVSEPIFRNIQKSIVPWLICWSKPNKKTITKERRATIQPWRRHPKPAHLQQVSLMGLFEAQSSSIFHKSQNKGCPYPKFDNSNLLPSCIERWGLSITKEINTVSNATYSTLHKNRPLLTKKLCFLKVLGVEFCTFKTLLSTI